MTFACAILPAPAYDHSGIFSAMTDVVIRRARDEDAAAIASLARNNARFYAGLATDLFRIPDAEGFVEFLRGDRDWHARPTSLALVAETEGHVAGYLEASLQEPSESARCQGEADLSKTRLFISFLGTDDVYKRKGFATRLVESAEDWGRERGAVVATCDTWIGSPVSVPFWEHRMGYQGAGAAGVAVVRAARDARGVRTAVAAALAAIVRA